MTSAAAIIVLGVGVGCLGLVLTVAALFRDRARGRRRCPRCWYDMSGVPGMTCPECGRTAKKERRFFRTRRRWRRAVAGALVMLVGTGTALVPTVRRYGVYRFLPSAVLVYLTPPIEEAYQVGTGSRLLTAHPVVDELLSRIERRGLAQWEWRVMLQRLRVVRTRAAWPVDRPLSVEVREPFFLGSNVHLTVRARLPGANDLGRRTYQSWDASGSSERREMLCPSGERPAGTIDLDTRSVAFDVQIWRAPNAGTETLYPVAEGGWQKLFGGELHLKVRGVRSMDRAMSAASSPDMDALMKSALKVIVARTSARTTPITDHVVLVGVDRDALGVHAAMAYTLRVHLRGHGEKLGDVSLWRRAALTSDPGFDWYEAHFADLPEDLTQSADYRRWEVEVEGIQEHVLCQWDRGEYWVGRTTFELGDVAVPQPSPQLMMEMLHWGR